MQLLRCNESFLFKTKTEMRNHLCFLIIKLYKTIIEVSFAYFSFQRKVRCLLFFSKKRRLFVLREHFADDLAELACRIGYRNVILCALVPV